MAGPAPTGKMEREEKQTAQVQFSFHSQQINTLITEEVVRTLFSLFGEVEDVHMKKFMMDPRSRSQSGHGLVHFPWTEAGISAALKASSAVRDVLMHGAVFDSSLSPALQAYSGQQQPQPFMAPPASFSIREEMRTAPTAAVPPRKKSPTEARFERMRVPASLPHSTYPSTIPVSSYAPQQRQQQHYYPPQQQQMPQQQQQWRDAPSVWYDAAPTRSTDHWEDPRLRAAPRMVPVAPAMKASMWSSQYH